MFSKVQKLQIILSKMSTTPGMYNYSANSILSSALCASLFLGALKDAMVVVLCAFVRCFFPGILSLGSSCGYPSGSWVI